MMNFAANHASRPCPPCTGNIAPSENARYSQVRRKSSPNRPISPRKCSRQSIVPRTLAFIINPPGIFLALHLRKEIRQVKSKARRPNSNPIRGIQTEKPHAGLSIARHIRAHIQFRKTRKPRHRQPCRAYAHPTCETAPRQATPVRQTYRSSSCAGISGRNVLHRHRPMREKQIVPHLPHDPRAARQRPRPVLRMLQNFHRIPAHHARFSTYLMRSIYPSSIGQNRISSFDARQIEKRSNSWIAKQRQYGAAA